MINTTIEQYLIKKKLGHGAMGSVYLAQDTLLDRPVALKFILSDFNDHPEMASRFLSEAKVLASLNRPNIPTLYGYFISSGRGVMAMEYVNGETLADMVSRRGPIPANVTVPLIKQALQGLAAAHRIGVVHRDLKPGNIMVDLEGTVKVVDFGIAKKLADEGFTATNTALGTPWYMAPEQVMGRPITARTDIYSMGVVLYEMLAGQVPFHADSIFQIQSAHVEQIPKPPTVHYPHIPQKLVDVVMKALQKDPGARFASAEEFMRALPDAQPAVVPEVTINEGLAATKAEQNAGTTKVEQTGGSIPRPGSAPSRFVETPVGREVKATAAQPVADIVEPATGRNRNWLIGGVGGLALLFAGTIAWFMKPPPTPVTGGGGSLSASNNQATRPLEHPPAGDTSVDLPPITPPSAAKPPKANSRPSPRATGSAGSTPAAGSTVVQPSVRAPAPGQELSGVWQGVYTDSNASDRSTRVLVRIQEQSGTTVNGTLSFIKTDHTMGSCSLQGSTYSPQTKQLKLLTHCSGVSPGYFNVPATFNGVDPSERSLSGRSLLPAVSIALQR